MTLNELKYLFLYKDASGEFIRKISTNKRHSIGSVAGTINGKGYITIKANKRCYKAHRLAWFYVYGEMPNGDIDHINGIKTDNRIANLRLANTSQNNSNVSKRKNNKSGFKGVCLHKSSQKWMANCGTGRNRKYLGLFDTPEEASSAYMAFASLAHKEFFKP